MRSIFTVVVVDDEEELLNAVCEMIPWESLGFELVGRAGNGLDALQLVESLEPDLLLSDIRMPYITGIELARQVRQLRPFTHIAFLSGYDDFDYAQKAIEFNAIRYLLKPISMEELSAALAEMHGDIQKHYSSFIAPAHPREISSFVASILLDNSLSEQELSEQELAGLARDAGLPDLMGGQMQQYVLAIELPKGIGGCSPQDLAHTVDLFLQKYCVSRSFSSGRRVLSLLVFDSTPSNLPNILDELLQAVGRIWGIKCRLGLSRSVKHWRDCRMACEEALDALRFVGAESGVANFQQPSPLPAPQDTRVTVLGDQLEGLIRVGTREDLDRFLTANLNACSGEDDILQIFATTLRVLHSTLPPEQISQIRRRCHLPDTLLGGIPQNEQRRRAMGLCMVTWEQLAQQRKDGVRLLCERALEEINNNYMDELLSLATVSDKLHVSSNYLSANMRKYVGDTFINLLIRKRMEVAGELIKSTNMKILEIAQRCGYSDQHYFSFCFKKYYGMSPIALRRKEERQAIQ